MGNAAVEPGHHLVAIKRSPEEWNSILEDFDDSSMSLASFCAERGLSPKKASNWPRRLRGDGGTGPSSPSNAPRICRWVSLDVHYGSILNLH